MGRECARNGRDSNMSSRWKITVHVRLARRIRILSLVEEIETSTIRPRWEDVADEPGRYPAAPQARVGGPDHCHAHVSTEKAHDLGIGLLPFRSNHPGALLQCCNGLPAQHAIHRVHQGREVPAPLEAGGQVLPLLLARSW